jgi:hypothetical protein
LRQRILERPHAGGKQLFEVPVRLPPIGGQGERQSLKGTQYYAKDQTCLQ